MLQVSVQADFLLLGFLKTEQNQTRDQIKIASALWEQIRTERIQAFVTPRCFDRVCSALSGYPNAKEVIASLRSVLEVLPHDPIIDEIAAASEAPYDYAVEVAYAREYGLDGIIADSRQGFCESSQEMTVFLPGALLLEVQQFDAFNPSAWKQICDRYREEFLNAAGYSEEVDQNELEDTSQNRSDNAGEPSYTIGNYQPIYCSEESEITLEEKVLSAAAYTTIRAAARQSAVRVEVGLANQSLTFEQAFSTNAALVWVRYTSAADKPTHTTRISDASWLTSLLPFKQDDLNEPPLSATAQIDRSNRGLVVTVLSANAQEFTRQSFFEFNQILGDRSSLLTNAPTQPILIPSGELIESAKAVAWASHNLKSESSPDPKKTIAQWQTAPLKDPPLQTDQQSPDLEISVDYQFSPSTPLPDPTPVMAPASPPTVSTPLHGEGPFSPTMSPTVSPTQPPNVPAPVTLLVDTPTREGDLKQGDGSLDVLAVPLSPENSNGDKKVFLEIDIHLSKDDSASVTVVFQKSEKFGLIGGATYDDATTEKTASDSDSSSQSIELSLQPSLLKQAIVLGGSQTLSQEFELRRSQLTQPLDYNGSATWTVEANTTPLGEIKLEFAFSRLTGPHTTLHMGCP